MIKGVCNSLQSPSTLSRSRQSWAVCFPCVSHIDSTFTSNDHHDTIFASQMWVWISPLPLELICKVPVLREVALWSRVKTATLLKKNIESRKTIRKWIKNNSNKSRIHHSIELFVHAYAEPVKRLPHAFSSATWIVSIRCSLVSKRMVLAADASISMANGGRHSSGGTMVHNPYFSHSSRILCTTKGTDM